MPIPSDLELTRRTVLGNCSCSIHAVTFGNTVVEACDIVRPPQFSLNF